MSNITWIDLPSSVTSVQVVRAMREAIQVKLSQAEIKEDSSTFWRVLWQPNDQYELDGVEVKLSHKGKRVSFHPGGLVGMYVEFVLRTTLGAKFNGTCGGEDVEVPFAPDPNQWPSWEAYEARWK